MRTEIKIAHLGGVMVEGAIIVAWLKREGEVVKKGAPVVTVETRKITVDVPAPTDGFLRQFFPAGARVKISDTIGALDSKSNPAELGKIHDSVTGL